MEHVRSMARCRGLGADGLMAVFAAAAACWTASPVAAMPIAAVQWRTVVNNNDAVPVAADPRARNFNSYNQPSVNGSGLVVFRGRSKGGQGAGEPASGIFTRDMSSAGGPLNVVASRASTAPVPPYTPQPGYAYSPTGATFNEFPAIPRIDATSATIAFRGQTQPVLQITDPLGNQTKVGTSAIYTTQGGPPAVGSSILGNVPGFAQYQVPGQAPGTKFDQFPGAPSLTDGSKIVFKGNWSGGTGVYWTDVSVPGSPIVRIADSTVAIPGDSLGTMFGSTAPPSAAKGQAVFLGVDNEDQPTRGGIYRAPLVLTPTLERIVAIGDVAPGFDVAGKDNHFTKLGEALSFDGRYMAFWAGVGSDTRDLALACPADGNQDVRAYCLANFDNYAVRVPFYQGIFLADTVSNSLSLVASTWGLEGFTDFLYWGFSGRPPGVGGGSEEDGLELARWRSTSFVAVDDGRVAFKGSMGDSFGLYLYDGSSPLLALAELGGDGGAIDPDAAGMKISALGIERDGFRNGWLAISAGMTDGENSMAGVYLTNVPAPAPVALVVAGIVALALRRRGR